MPEIYQPKAIELRAWSSVPMEYTVLYRGESHGRLNTGIVIAASLGKEPFDPDQFGYEKDKDANRAISMAAESVSKALLTALEKNNGETKARAAQDRERLMGLFSEAPFQVEELPNGYCHDWCCINLPWYCVLTRIGWIKIGWRKSVINIDWSETVIKQSGDDLFPGATFTVGKGYDSEHNPTRYCHAWGYDKAREQLAVILTALREKHVIETAKV